MTGHQLASSPPSSASYTASGSSPMSQQNLKVTGEENVVTIQGSEITTSVALQATTI